MSDELKLNLKITLKTLEKIYQKGDLSYLMLSSNYSILLPNTKWIESPPEFPDAGEIVNMSMKGTWESGYPPLFVGGVIVYAQGSTLHQGNNQYQFIVSMDTASGQITAPVPGGGPWPNLTWSVQVGDQEVTFIQSLTNKK
jgi:hypothetical protein